MGFSTVSEIVTDVCDVIWNTLQPTYMPQPTTELWENNIAGFMERWQFPNCLGAIDGKHVTIKCPKNSVSQYWCYLKKFSTVLMAIVDFDYKFTCIDVGAYGKNSDSGIFEASLMGQKFSNGTMEVPLDRPLPNETVPTPCILVGDEAFALSSYMMRPYPYKQSRVDRRKENFNYRLCRTRRIVENAFGILVQKWRLFNRPIETDIKKTIIIVKTACLLHNFLRIKNCDQHLQHLLDIEDREDSDEITNRPSLVDLPNSRRRPGNFAFEIRERFADFFIADHGNEENMN